MSAFVEDGFPVPRALELCVLGADRPDIRAIDCLFCSFTPPLLYSLVLRLET